MKTDIHPKYNMATVTCVCGNSFVTGSTDTEIKVEICYNCHPLYTGQQKIVDTEGRVERFMRRFKKSEDIKAEADARAEAKEKAAKEKAAKEKEE